MAQANQINHRYVADPCLPYSPSNTPVASDPSYQDGADLLTSWKAYAERRPGWVPWESSKTTYTGKIVRIWGFRKWAGTFYQIINVVDQNLGTSSIYKKATSDPSFSLLFASSSLNPFDMAVSSNMCFFGNGVDMIKWAAGTVISFNNTSDVAKWGMPIADNSLFSVSAHVKGTFGITTVYGDRYVIALGNSITGGIGSVSSVDGTFLGPLTDQNAQIQLTPVPLSDPQADQLHTYRTTDGGGGVFYELDPSLSPLPAAAGGTLFDNNLDASNGTAQPFLQAITQAPVPGFNDPPPPASHCTWFQNRIWIAQNNKVFYSGWEEINNGLEEECFPSGPAGNFYALSSEVTAMSTVQGALMIFCADAIYTVTGDSLQTFQLSRFVEHMGARTQANVCRMGRMTAWLDISDTVQISDGYSVSEISKDIRTKIKGIDHTQSCLAFHTDGQYRWLMLLDGANSLCYVYDIDEERWMVPWTFGGAYLKSVETSPGHYELLLGAANGTVCAMSLTNYVNPDGTTYAPFAVTNLMSLFQVSPYYDSPKAGHVGKVEYVSVEADALSSQPSRVQIGTDDDPQLGVFRDITGYGVDPPLRYSASNLSERWYYDRSRPARRACVRFDWPAQNSNFKLYSFDLGYDPVGVGNQ